MNLFKQKVRIDEQHRYWHDDGSEYVGFSKLWDAFMTKPFNAEMAAIGVARSVKNDFGSTTEVLNQWEKQRDEGSRIDDCITMYWGTGLYKPEDEDIIDGVKEILKVYDEYDKSFGQVLLYNDKYKVAGTCDRLSLVSNRKDCPFVMSDFKCFEDGDLEKVKSPRFLNAPFDYLANTKYVKICFQMSFYSYLFEGLTGRKPLKQYIHWIEPNSVKRDSEGMLNVIHRLVPAVYLRSDVEKFLEINKEAIALMVNKNVEAW